MKKGAHGPVEKTEVTFVEVMPLTKDGLVVTNGDGDPVVKEFGIAQLTTMARGMTRKKNVPVLGKTTSEVGGTLHRSLKTRELGPDGVFECDSPAGKVRMVIKSVRYAVAEIVPTPEPISIFSIVKL